MHKLKFTKDKGSDFYKELIEKTDQYFIENKRSKAGNNLMLFKILLYFWRCKQPHCAPFISAHQSLSLSKSESHFV
jgi:hypothetical protein